MSGPIISPNTRTSIVGELQGVRHRRTTEMTAVDAPTRVRNLTQKVRAGKKRVGMDRG